MKNILFLLTAILLVSCSHKQTPQITIPTTYDKCDSAIQQILDSIKAVKPKVITRTVSVSNIKVVKDTIVDSSECNYYKVQALELAQKLHTANKETEYFKSLAQSRAKKIINNINSGNKNTQIGDGNVQQNKPKGPAIVGDGNVTPVKPKQSAIGDGNKLDNSKKGVGWFWLILVGYLGCHVIHKIAIPALMGTNPFTAGISRIKRVFSVFRT